MFALTLILSPRERKSQKSFSGFAAYANAQGVRRCLETRKHDETISSAPFSPCGRDGQESPVRAKRNAIRRGPGEVVAR